MELSDLRTFIAVARHGGITKAAAELHTVQSNISTRILALEKELGVSLFHRHARGVVLSSAGEQLLAYAEKITRLVDDARRSLGDVDDPSGPLRLGSMETTVGLRLPGVMASFLEACPRVRLSLHTGPTEHLIQDVLEYRLDGALVCGPVSHDELVATHVCNERLALITSRAVTDLEAVLREPRILVFRSGCSYRRRLESLLHARGAAGVQCTELGTLEGILGCVAAGMGVTLLPAAIAETSPSRKHVRLHHLPNDESLVETVFIRRADTPASPGAQRFLELVRNAHTQPELRVVESQSS
jgi:DNA-binding transcriptional LysR family regulator